MIDDEKVYLTLKDDEGNSLINNATFYLQKTMGDTPQVSCGRFRFHCHDGEYDIKIEQVKRITNV